MRQILKKSILLSSCVIPMLSFAFENYDLKDPSGKYLIQVNINKNNISYSLKHENQVMIDQSPISLSLTDGRVIGADPVVRKVKRNKVAQKINPPLYRKKEILDNYNEMQLDFKGDYSITFRAYEDGVAYRFSSNFKKPYFVENEEFSLNTPADSKVYIASPKGRMNEGKQDPFYSSFQNTYKYKDLTDWNEDEFVFLPALIETNNGKKICITEADLLNYPGMYLNSKGHKVNGVFPGYPKDVSIEVKGLKGVVKSRESYIAKAEGKTQFPWRVFIVSENDTELLDNDMVYKLATPAKFTDFSWIKPGKVAWDWWNNWNIYNVDFESGVNNDTYKYYIDFAADNGIEYVILDEGWSVEGVADLMTVVPEIDLEELIQYGQKKNVDLILWAGYKAFDKNMDEVCRHYADMGIKGFKIDFMDRDDQYMIDFNRRAAETGAKHKLLIDLHGTSKPTGLQRTYPNTINFEGVHGLEELKWAAPGTDQVIYDVTMPFIRMVAGPVDYTQGAMNNAVMQNFKPIYNEPMSQGTRCRQLAAYVIFESPLNMLCDAPSNYMKEKECTDFISAIPTVWDETKPLNGEISKYVTIARRKDDTWYIGSLNDWDNRNIELDLSFLGEGNFKAELFKDGKNATKIGKDYKREVIDIDTNKKFTCDIAPGGGFAMKIYKQ